MYAHIKADPHECFRSEPLLARQPLLLDEIGFGGSIRTGCDGEDLFERRCGGEDCGAPAAVSRVEQLGQHRRIARTKGAADRASHARSTNRSSAAAGDAMHGVSRASGIAAMSRMFFARSRNRRRARKVVLNTGCERDAKVAALGEAVLGHTTKGDVRATTCAPTQV